MTESDIRLAWLHECPGVGPSLLRRVLDRYGAAPPPAFFGRTPAWYRTEFNVPEKASFAMADHLSGVPSSLIDASNWPVSLLYGNQLNEIPVGWLLSRAPAVLYCLGNHVNVLPAGHFCVVASQKQEHLYASEVKDAIQQGLAAGRHVVAGHNRPVYQWALTAAKRMGARATVVLDRGLLAAFGEDLRRDPVPAARIWGYDFDREHMCALSPFRLRDPWIGANARLRDAMVVALSEVIVAVGIREGGTMDRLCREAAGRGRTVLAAPDCLPFLEPCGALPWTGVFPPRDPHPSLPGKIG